MTPASLPIIYRTFRRHPGAARLHTLIRYLTCPFNRILPHLPREARSLLEIGGGHGVFSRLAAARGVRRVVAIEPDVRKVMGAPVEGVSLVAGFDDVLGGTFDVVAIIDVLYTIPLREWDVVLKRAFDRLPSGGTLLVKEQDPEAKVKNFWNRTQEWLAQNVLRVTLARTFNYESREAFTARLERLGFRDVTWRRIDFGYPHPHVLFVARR